MSDCPTSLAIDLIERARSERVSDFERGKCPLCAQPTHPLDCDGCSGWGYIESVPPKTCRVCKGSGREACPPR